MRLALWALASQDDVLLGTNAVRQWYSIALMHKRMEHTVPSVSGTVPWLVDFSLTMAIHFTRTGDCKMYATEKQNRGSDCSLIVVSLTENNRIIHIRKAVAFSDFTFLLQTFCNLL